MRDDRRLNALSRGRLRVQRGACPRLTDGDDLPARARFEASTGPGRDAVPDASTGGVWLGTDRTFRR